MNLCFKKIPPYWDSSPIGPVVDKLEGKLHQSTYYAPDDFNASPGTQGDRSGHTVTRSMDRCTGMVRDGCARTMVILGATSRPWAAIQAQIETHPSVERRPGAGTVRYRLDL